MKTAMQELLENLQKSFDEKTYPIRIDATYFLEKKEANKRYNQTKKEKLAMMTPEERYSETVYWLIY